MSLLIFPGTFDPVTVGHLDLLRRTLRIADRAVVAVAVHPDKKNLFTPEQRVDFWKSALAALPDENDENARTEVIIWEGLTADLLAQCGGTAVVRGVRDSVDLAWEQRLHEANRQLCDGFETLWLPTDPAFRWISSSVVRELLVRNRSVEALVPAGAAEGVVAAFEEKRREHR